MKYWVFNEDQLIDALSAWTQDAEFKKQLLAFLNSTVAQDVGIMRGWEPGGEPEK